MDFELNKRLKLLVAVTAAFLACLFVWGIYIPKSSSSEMLIYTVARGVGSKEIAIDLEQKGIIKNDVWFRLYVAITGRRTKLQAGRYAVAQNMSVARIVAMIAQGDIAKERLTILEGWDIHDIATYLENKQVMGVKDFLALQEVDRSKEFDFLASKPKALGLEGYLFPDTYAFSVGQEPEALIQTMLTHFGEKLTPDLRTEITRQKKTIFQVITMASILEKEVRTLEDKKIVAGILWKRIAEGMPLQVDATVNYITRKDHPGVTIVDTKIDSPYNTYKYYGLPLGPISNPGIESIIAAIYPTKSEYWYYLSDAKTGKTIFSKTFEEHNAAIVKHL